MQEIERKFLVRDDSYKKEAQKHTHIIQGFLNTHPERTVRVRIYGNQGKLTIKGKSNASGTTRFEWEHDISKEESEALLKLCEPGIIDKIRYEVTVDSHVFEVDEFKGSFEGLVIAEIELTDENEVFPKPAWLGEEVTENPAYYNSNLIKKMKTEN